MFLKIFIFIIALVAGLYFLVKSEYIVRVIGHNAWAEKYLGAGGTYLMWKLLGILVIILGFLYLLGDLDSYVNWGL
jgi:hypothetical protein